MYCTVKRLRHGGKRLPDHVIYAQNGATGHLSLNLVMGIPHLRLHGPGDQSETPIVPDLERAELIAMHANKMLFRGIEKINGAEVAQEWSVLINVDAPASRELFNRIG